MFVRPWVLIHRMAYAVPLAAVLLLLGGSPAFAQAAAGAAGWAAKDCAACHDKAVGPAFSHSKHAGLDQSCAN